MGTWGYKNFENDDAMNWVGRISDSKDLMEIVATLQYPMIVEDPCDCLNLWEILIAAEILAGVNGYEAPDLPREVKKIIEQLKGVIVGKSVLYSAMKAVNVVLDSEAFKKTWFEENVYEAWRAVAINLRERLNPNLGPRTKKSLLKEYSKITLKSK